MIQPVSKFFNFADQNNLHRIHYLDWGKSEYPVVVCAHGLTRNSRDFDYLARSLCEQFRVIAIDFPGRGLSDWLEDKNSYVIPIYLEVVKSLLETLEVKSFNWLGTSMGGLIGIFLAAQNASKLKRLIVNDIGPEIPDDAINRINDYLANIYKFDNQDEFEKHIRQIYAPFGCLSNEQWQHLTYHSHKSDTQGKLVSNYDPGIAVPFEKAKNIKSDIWDIWQSLTCPVYLLYGENSDILNATIIAKMKQLQPGLKSKSVKNVGHAPALMDNDQTQQVKHWLTDSRS